MVPAVKVSPSPVTGSPGSARAQGQMGHRKVAQGSPHASKRPSDPSPPAQPFTIRAAAGVKPLGIYEKLATKHPRVPDSAQARREYGDPKPDIAITGQVLHAHSSRYKTVLRLLDNYRDATNATLSYRDPAVTFRRRQDELSGVENAMKAYVENPGNGSRERDMADQLERIVHERELLTATEVLVTKLGGAASMSPANLVDLHRSGVSIKSLEQALRAGWSATKVNRSEQAAFDRARVPQTPVNGVGPYSHETLVDDSVKELGKGNISTVWAATYLIDGKKTAMVFKPETPGAPLGIAAESSGIPVETPNLCGRSVATRLIDQLLRLDLVPPTHVTALDGRLGSVMGLAEGAAILVMGSVRRGLPEAAARSLAAQPATLARWATDHGFVAARLEGRTLIVDNWQETARRDSKSGAVETKAGERGAVRQDREAMVCVNTTAPAFRRRLTQLQWLDTLCGQVDRNPQNTLMQWDDKGHLIAMQAIDNDAAMGAQISAADDDKMVKRRDNFRARMPQVIDAALYEGLTTLDEAIFRNELTGHLSDDEVTQAVVRLQQIKARLETFSADQIVHDEADWGSPDVSALLGVDHDGLLLAKAVAPLQPAEGARASPQAHRQVKYALEALQLAARQASYVARESFSLAQLRWQYDSPERSQAMGPAPALLDLPRLLAMAASAEPLVLAD
ncbi:MAG TPA: hypothetical protein VLJ86_11190 [Ramlibacter sp.]|nr:hypothetical protein [Ramlibacter sp.]